MTETWAGLLRSVANEGGDAWRYAPGGIYLAPDAVIKLFRLASLLEQITPEMVEDLTHLVAWRADQGMIFALRALSTAPTEETE